MAETYDTPPLIVAEGPPWERHPREPDLAWSLFRDFRDGAYPEGPGGVYVPRDLGKFCKLVGISRARATNLAGSFHWYPRVGAYDREIDRARTEVDMGAIPLMRARHTRILTKARTYLESELDKILSRADAPDVTQASPKEVMQMLDILVRLERQTLGQTAEGTSPDGAIDLGRLELADLQTLDAIRRKSKGLPG